MRLATFLAVAALGLFAGCGSNVGGGNIFGIDATGSNLLRGAAYEEAKDVCTQYEAAIGETLTDEEFHTAILAVESGRYDGIWRSRTQYLFESWDMCDALPVLPSIRNKCTACFTHIGAVIWR